MAVDEALGNILRKQKRIDMALRKEYFIEYAKTLTLYELLIEKGTITAKEFKEKFTEKEHELSKELLKKMGV